MLRPIATSIKRILNANRKNFPVKRFCKYVPMSTPPMVIAVKVKSIGQLIPSSTSWLLLSPNKATND